MAGLAASLLLWSASQFICERIDPALVVDPVAIDLKGHSGSQVHTTITITNKTQSVITLIGAQEGCATVCCINEVSGLPAKIRPNDRTKVSVAIQIRDNSGLIYHWPIFTDSALEPELLVPVRFHKD